MAIVTITLALPIDQFDCKIAALRPLARDHSLPKGHGSASRNSER
jgi:hypothetical protein